MIAYSCGERPCSATVSGVMLTGLWGMGEALSGEGRVPLAPPRLTPATIPAIPSRMQEQGSEISQMSFEDALRALEDVVRKLETGEVPLDDSISLYERGEALRRHCLARLDAAQARIEKIVAGPDGKAVGMEPFEA
jgi:exodeoxyribonuclease VII small subunit